MVVETIKQTIPFLCLLYLTLQFERLFIPLSHRKINSIVLATMILIQQPSVGYPISEMF